MRRFFLKLGVTVFVFLGALFFSSTVLAVDNNDGEYGDEGGSSEDGGAEGGEPTEPTPEELPDTSGGDGNCGVDADGNPIECQGEDGPQQDGDGGAGANEEDLSGYVPPNVEPPVAKPIEAYKPIGIDLDGLQTKASELNPGGFKSPELFVGRLIKGVMGIVGSLSLVMFIYGGILLMTDRGGGEQSAKAKEIIVWTSLGLAVIFAAYAIVDFIFEAFR